MNYIVKHWQGKLSLATAFWINTALIHIFVLAAILLFVYFIKDLPALARTLMYFSVLVILPISIWQIVGLWRTCNVHIETTHKILWPNVIKVLIVIGLVSTAASYKSYQKMYRIGFSPVHNIIKTGSAAEIEKSILSVPAYATIKKYNPKLYEVFKNKLIEKVNSGASQLEIQKIGSEFVNQIAAKELPKTSDKALIEYTKMIIKTLKISEKENPLNCLKSLYPDKFGEIDGSKVFTAAQLDDVLKVLDTVVVEAHKNPYTGTIDREKVVQLIKAIAVKHPEIFKNLNTNNLTTPADYKRSCDAVINLYEVILNEQGEMSPMILRFMFSQ